MKEDNQLLESTWIKNNKIQKDDIFSLKTDYTNKKKKVKINSIQKNETVII